MIKIPALQKVARVQDPGPNARFVIQTEQAIPQPHPDQVLVKLEVAGLCHSDLNRVYGQLPLVSDIVGHEGVGTVIQAGSDALSYLLLKRVGLGWLSRACLECNVCAVEYTSCPKQQNLGRDLTGTFQQYIAVDANFVHPVPDELSAEAAAPLLCAGISMYSAINKAKIRPGDWLLLPGAGGGLGHLGIQIAKAQGYKVIAVDTGADKRKVCEDMGATVFLDFRQDDVLGHVQKITGLGADAVICTAGSIAAYEQAVACVRNAGTIACIGVHPDNLPLSPLDMVRRGLRLFGSAVGTKEEMQDLFQLAVKGQVKPLIKVVPFDQIDEIARRLERGQISGRIVMTISHP